MSAVPEAAMEHRAYGSALLHRGLWVAAGEQFRSWLDLVLPTGDANLVLPPLNALCAACNSRKESEGALTWLTMALPFLDQAGVDPGHLARNRNNRVKTLTEVGRHEQAYQEAPVAVAASQRSGSPWLVGVAYLNWGRIYGRRHEWLQARRMADLALNHFHSAGDQDHAARALLNRGLAHLELGALRLAERDFVKAQGIFAQAGGSVIQAYAYTEMGRLAYLQGNPERALELGSKTLDVLLSDLATVDKEEVARVSALFGTVFAEQNNRNLALKFLNRSAAYFSQLGRLGEWQRVTGEIGRLLTNCGRWQRATESQAASKLEFLTAMLDLTDDIESVDPYLRGHSERVASLAGMISRHLGLTAAELRLVTFAGRLHDVGKVAVDTSILTKQGPLSPAEWERVRIHPVIGEEMIRPYGLDTDGLAAVRHHHERWRGGGYPDGIEGEEIPLLARILSVADVYDAVTSDRAYRKAMTHGQAMGLLKQMAGRELDPQLVDVFFRMHEV